MFIVAWLNARPYCWVASIDGGKTYTKLKADNNEDSSEAIDEAADTFGVSPNRWDLADNPINSLTP